MKILNILQLSEARRNPDHPAQEKLSKIDIFKQFKSLPDEERNQLYVSFTEIDKLGINPLSTYDTPIGVYTYPLNYVLSHINTIELPFAGDHDNVWVIKPNQAVLSLVNYNNLDDDKRKALDYLLSVGWDNADAVALS